MRTATVLLVVTFLVLIGGVGAFGVGQLSGGGTLTEQWVSETSRTLRVNHHPVAATATGGDAIIVAPINEISSANDLTDTSCVVARLGPSNGTIEWQAGLPAANCTIHSVTGPTIADIDADGTMDVLVGTGDHNLTAYDAATGAIEWRHPIAGLGYSEPAVGDFLPAPGKEVVIADIRGRVDAVYANGTTAWEHDHAISTWANPQLADFTGDTEMEIAVGTESNVSLYRPDGDLVWQTNVSSTWSSIGQADDDPAAELFIADQGQVTAIDGDDGATIWSRRFDSTAAIASVSDADGDGSESVFVGLSGGTVRALDAADGTNEWTTKLPGNNRIMPPPRTGDVNGDGSSELVAMAQEGAVYVLDPSSGEQLATYDREVSIWTYPALADIDGDGDEDILVMYGDARVVALSYES